MAQGDPAPSTGRGGSGSIRRKRGEGVALHQTREWQLWSPEEDGQLRQAGAEGKTTAGAAQLLGRSVSSVRKRAFTIGVKLVREKSVSHFFLDWNASRVGLLTQLWGEGLSASLIGARLGVSRSAVIGKVHRLGLAGRATTTRQHNKVAAKTRKARAAFLGIHYTPEDALPRRPPPPPRVEDVARESIFALDKHHRSCRWVCVDDPTRTSIYEPMFCGLAAVVGQPYCEGHLHRATTPPALRRLPRNHGYILTASTVRRRECV